MLRESLTRETPVETVVFQGASKEIGDLLAVQFANRTLKNRMTMGPNKATQKCLFKLLLSIASGASLFGLMYGLDSLLIAGVISSMWTYYALFQLGLLLKNVIFGALTHNIDHRSFNKTEIVKVLWKSFRVSSLLLTTLFIAEEFLITTSIGSIIFPLFYCFLSLKETMFTLSLFQLDNAKQLNVSRVNSLLSYKWQRVLIASLLPYFFLTEIIELALLSTISTCIKVFISYTNWLVKAIFLCDGIQGYRDLSRQRNDDLSDAMMNNIIHNGIACWLDIINFKWRWDKDSIDFIPLKQALAVCPESKTIIDLAERLSRKELELGKSMSPKEHLAYLLTTYSNLKGTFGLFKHSKPDALIVKTLLDKMRDETSTLKELLQLFSGQTLSKEVDAIAKYLEYVLIPMEDKMQRATNTLSMREETPSLQQVA